MATKASYRADDKPVSNSNQLVESTDKRYFYEEVEIPEARWEQTGNGLIGGTSKIVIVKNGRSVDLFMTGLSAPVWGAGGHVVFTAPEVDGGYFIPERFRPITKEGVDITFTAQCFQFGGAIIAGTLRIEKATGKMTFSVSACQAPPLGLLTDQAAQAGQSLGVLDQHFHWICDGVSNKAIEYA